MRNYSLYWLLFKMIQAPVVFTMYMPVFYENAVEKSVFTRITHESFVKIKRFI